MTEQESEIKPSTLATYSLPLVLYIVALLGLLLSAGYVAHSTYRQATETATNRSAAHADLVAELVANRLISVGCGPEDSPRICSAPGVIVAGQSPEALSGSLARLSLPAGQSIAILDESMRLVTRIPAAPGDAFSKGQVIKDPEIRRFIDSGSDSDQMVTNSSIDGEERFYAVKRVPGAPYLVVAGEKTSVALQGWHQSLWAGATGILLVSIIGLFFLKQFYQRLSVAKELLRENKERRSLQQSAQANEARLQALVNSIPDLIFVFDEQGRFAFVQAQDESQLLMPAEKLLGLHYSEVLPPELAGRFDRIKADVEKTQKTREFEYRLFDKGEARDYEARVSTLAGIEGQYSGFMAVVRNITESKAQAAELRIASTAFETHLGIMITDESGVLLRANKAFSRITGYAEHEVVGKTPRILHSGLQDAAFYNHLWSRVRENGSWEGELWNLRKDGKAFAEWLTITAVYGESGIVQNYVGSFHDITKRKDAEREAHRLAFYDSLTGLANRALLEERISDAGKTNTRQNAYAALLYLEIEQLRAVNDAWGYRIGDLVLKALAERLGALVRESDTLARIGGDEFAILLSNLDASLNIAARSAESVANKILEAFSRPIDVLEQTIQVNVSIGITLIDGQIAPCDQQLQKAEQATQQAKERARLGGEKRISFFDPEIQAQVVQHLLLEEELRNALAEEQLVLYYQPQIRNPNQLLGYEVLLRWRHPKRGTVSPDVFIPIAEQSRLILPIGQWIIEQACEKLSAWQSEPASSELSLAVNVSVVQFQSDDFVEQVSRILEKTGAPPHLLKLEVTESLLMGDPERITGMMNRLRSMGVRFSLDDFGTGYSSMSYLNRLPLDQIKIDQSFTREVTVNPASSAIVESIIGLAKGLNLEVIAEGVETEEQRNWLANHGCQNFQGYLFGRPEEI